MLPVYVTYLLKLSLGLAAVYLFYRLVLQNLTFYQCNRWFLLIFTALAFLIPLVDIAAWVEPKQDILVVKYIPVVEEITTGNLSVVPANIPETSGYDLWHYLLMIVVTGSGILLTRSVMQFFSFFRIRRHARLVSDQEIKIYEVDGDITPFSFGRSIFLNASIQQEKDLQEIIRHELVHVQQGHTADILWMELVCILNWYNPFAWLLRQNVRQNLEFIADNHVLKTGTDKKHYQYLLLHIKGKPAFRLAHQFNFSPLKERILMMNKKPSSRTHLVKFAFLLPLVAILLVSFRNETKNIIKGKDNGNYVLISGLVVNASTLEPLANASVKEENSKEETATDHQGYYKLKIPMDSYQLKTLIRINKAGFAEINSPSAYRPLKYQSLRSIKFFGLATTSVKGTQKGAFVSGGSAIVESKEAGENPSYMEVMEHFTALKSGKQDESELKKLIAGSDKPYWVVNGKSYVATATGSYASTDEFTDVVFVDGKRMTGKHVNKKIKNSSIVSLGALEKESALLKYEINQPVLEIYINSKPVFPPAPASPK